MPSPTVQDQARVDQAQRVKLLYLRKETPEMITLFRELAYRQTQVQARLLECKPEDLGKLQGEAKAYSKLLRDVREFKEIIDG